MKFAWRSAVLLTALLLPVAMTQGASTSHIRSGAHVCGGFRKTILIFCGRTGCGLSWRGLPTC